MFRMYLLGLGAVWVALMLSWQATALFARFNRDWDRAFIRELQADHLRVPNVHALEDRPGLR